MVLPTLGRIKRCEAKIDEKHVRMNDHKLYSTSHQTYCNAVQKLFDTETNYERKVRSPHIFPSFGPLVEPLKS